jgi:DNA-binding NarL/FixJ family response regulator
MLGALVGHFQEMGYNVVGSYPEVAPAVDGIFVQRPDILLIGLEGAGAAMSAIKPLRFAVDGLLIVAYGPDNSNAIVEALRQGADAYVLRSAPLDDLASALEQLFQRTIYLQNPRSDSTLGADTTSPLTKKESELLARLASSGAKTTDLAQELGVAEQTIKFHLTNIYRKLGVENRTEAAVWAREHGLVDK